MVDQKHFTGGRMETDEVTEIRPLKMVEYHQYLKIVRIYVQEFGIRALKDMVKDIRQELVACDAYQADFDRLIFAELRATKSYQLYRKAEVTQPLSLDVPSLESADYTLLDAIEDESSLHPLGIVFRKEMASIFEDFFNNGFKTRALKVVAYRFGIGCRAHTLQELSDAMGVTRERIRQLEARGLEQLKEYLQSRGVTAELLD
jgi:DNA-directed RNA polymerase sigma subunit (sigma70/sigma32)